MGQLGLEWPVVGFGDFSGNAAESGMLMRNKNTGQFESYDINHSQLTLAALDFGVVMLRSGAFPQRISAVQNRRGWSVAADDDVCFHGSELVQSRHAGTWHEGSS